MPASRPPSLATMATLSPSAMRMVCGARRQGAAWRLRQWQGDRHGGKSMPRADFPAAEPTSGDDMTISRRNFTLAATASAFAAPVLEPGQVAVQADRLHRSVPGRRNDRHPGAPDRPEARPGARHDDRRRQQGRRRRQRRLGDGVARRARRLHDPRRHDQLARDQRQPLSEDRLRPDQVVRADHADRHQPDGARRQPGAARTRRSPTSSPRARRRSRSPAHRPAAAPRSISRSSC